MEVIAVGRGWSGCFPILIVNILIKDYYLQRNNFLSLRAKNSIVVGAFILVHASGKKGEIKKAASLTKSPHLWSLIAA